MIRYGNEHNYWLHSETEMDVSRGAKETVTIETTTLQLKFDPTRAAIVIIDMQNFFLSEKLGRAEKGRLLTGPIEKAVQFGREHGMRIIWVNWGVRKDLANLSPAVLRTFARGGVGFGGELPDNLGPLLLKDSWSAELIPPLEAIRTEEDFWVDKHRTSGFYGTELKQILDAQGITTLFFAGVNTDQCVSGTLEDAYCYGYDGVLLTDCTATTSPDFAYQGVLFNAERSGFLTTSEQLSAGVKTVATEKVEA